MTRSCRDGGRIARQVAIILLGSLFLAHALSAAVWIRLAPPPPSIQVLAGRIETVIQLADAAPGLGRDAIVAAAARSDLAVRLASRRPDDLGRHSWHGARLLRDALAHRGSPPARDIIVGVAAGSANDLGTVAASLDDGTWLLFTIPANELSGTDFVWLTPFIDILFGAIPLALLSIWAARRVTGPLVRLATAAEHVGTIDDSLPLPEEGTQEIRKVARALNALLDKLRRFVGDRTRMLAAIGHDLRTPLTRLRLRVEGVADPVARDKMLQDILRMDAMIASTLAFIRDDGCEEAIEPTDMAALLMTVCDAFADAGAEITYAGPLHAAGACRPQAMERALSNLIDNAVKFGGGAEVTLSMAGTAPVIDIDDEGPGIPVNERDEVFKPFTRGDSARGIERGGVGLGLAIARSIVHAHGGSIELDDRVPHGLRVRVRLPGGQRPAPSRATPRLQVAAHP